MDLKKTHTHESKAVAGVTFTIRTLNQFQRAQRDIGIAKERLEYSRKYKEMDEARNRYAPTLKELTDETARRELIAALPHNQQMELASMNQELEMMRSLHLVSSSIKAGLVSVAGLTVDGSTVSKDNFMDLANDALIDEVYAACEEASGLNEEQQKN